MIKKQLNQKLKQILNDLKPYKPEKVILFGSHARGDAHQDSDIDLLIVKKTNKPKWERSREILKLVYKKEYYLDDEKFPGSLDIKIYTPRELARRMALGDFFIEEVMEQGKTIYERK